MWTHKLRSFLMLLGVILSVATLILVVSLVNGVNVYFADHIANLGMNVFRVNRFPIIRDQREWITANRRNKMITWEDYEAVRDGLELPRQVACMGRKNGRVRAERQTIEDVDVRGITANYAEMSVEEPATGRHITGSDDEHRATTAMIGSDLATKLFPTVDPLGKTISVDGHEFTVIGVGKSLGSAFGRSQDNYVIIPIQTFLKIYGANTQSLSINVQARGPGWMERTQEEARVFMRARRHLAPNDPDTFGIIGSDSLMDLWKSLTGTLASGMIGIVMVFLVIGGVVIMNVMLASVTERTREIGIRKSLGARRRDILTQFLVESIFMSAMGGLMGLFIAWALATLVRMGTSVPMAVPVVAVVIAIGTSSLIGTLFGVYPASKAAKLDPIEALRFEV